MQLREFWRRVFTPVRIVTLALVIIAVIVFFHLESKERGRFLWPGRTFEIPIDVLVAGGQVYTNTAIVRYNPIYGVVTLRQKIIRMAISNLPASYQTQLEYAAEKAAQFLVEENAKKRKIRAAELARQVFNQRSEAASLFGPVAPAPYAGFQFSFVNDQEGLASSEGAFTNAVRAIQANGLQNNFPWLILDDGWYDNTPGPTVARAMTNNFPHGIQWIINYGHTNGFKVGLYFSVNFVLDSGYPTYDLDTNLLNLNVSNYVAWGVDMVFIDHINSTERAGTETIISAFRKAALAHNRPMRVILNNNGSTDFQPWMQEADGVNCHIDGSSEDFTGTFFCIFNQIQNQIPFSGYDCWPDFNTVGTWQNDTNYFKASMGILSVAPFSYFLGTTNWNAATLQILTNSVLNAIHQDKSGRLWTSIPTTAAGQVWARPLADGRIAVVLFNATLNTNTADFEPSLSPANIAFSLTAIGVPTNQVENVCNVFGQTSLTATNTFNWTVNSNSAEVFVFSPAGSTASTTDSCGNLVGAAVNINRNDYVDTYDSGRGSGTISCNPSAGTITVTNAGTYLVSGTIFMSRIPDSGSVRIGVLTNATSAVIFDHPTGNLILRNGGFALSFSGVVVPVPAMTTFEFFVDRRQSPSAQQATFFVQKL